MNARIAGALSAGFVLFVVLVALVPAPGSAAPHASVGAATASEVRVAPAGPARAAPPVRASPSPPSGAAGSERVAPELPAAPTPAGAPKGWDSSDFFADIGVGFSGRGFPSPFLMEPFGNTVPENEVGFWMNLTSVAPILFANVTIWSTQWSTTGASVATLDFSPAAPRLDPMVVNQSDPYRASFYFNDYRFFWPGSSVWFNVTVVGLNSTPSQVESSWNDSVPVDYPGGFVNNATWEYSVATPWASTNFSDDIAISSTPNVLGTPAYAPNPNQTLMVSIRAIDVGGTVAPIPRATLDFTVDVNGTVGRFAQPFGPVNQTTMSLVKPIGPYDGATISFNVTAWLPWEGGQVDTIQSTVATFRWSPNGGWWRPLAGLTANAQLATSPSIPTAQPGVAVPVLPTAEPVDVTVHEPIENVTVSSSQIDFTYSDNGLSHAGSVVMTALSANTTEGVLPGLPPGAVVTFYVVAKDIYGNPVSSGNYSYQEAGPTNPPLPEGRGLLYTEVLDLSGGGLDAGFAYTISNATWSASGIANSLGFAVPLLPGSTTPVELAFGTYELTVHAFGTNQSANVTLAPGTPTPTVVFYGESTPIPIVTTASAPVESVAAALGLLAAAIVTLPLVLWYEERRARIEAEQRRVTF
jgi:hypothetical protein